MRVVSGYGTVSAIVSNSTSALQVRDNREAAASSASASDLANGQGDKEEEAGSKKSGDSLTEAEDKSNTAKVRITPLLLSFTYFLPLSLQGMLWLR